MLNAGAGVYEIQSIELTEIWLDIFTTPIQTRQLAVCSTVESLPFPADAFDVVICVGEVLGYCDPAAAIREFARVLVPDGLLICDYGSSRSIRHWLRGSFGRAADLVTDIYNDTPERTWVYDPRYIGSLLDSYGFEIKEVIGTHTWSALARRLGASSSLAVSIQKFAQFIRLPAAWADVTTVAAVRSRAEK